MYRSREQKLVDLTFECVATALRDERLRKLPLEGQMEWVARQLRECGFPTEPMGASWGVLKP